VIGAGARPAEARTRGRRPSPWWPAGAALSRATAHQAFALLASGILAAACTSSPAPIPSSSPSPTPAPTLAAADVETFRFAVSGDPSSLLPLASDADTRRIHAFLYDALYRLDEALRPVPVLAAEAPAVSRDGLRWSIPLQSGLTFSDGTPLDAADVVDPPPGALDGLSLRRGLPHRRRPLADVKAEGDSVVLTLSKPWSPLLATSWPTCRSCPPTGWRRA
jgi:peptide/nickel transport system substrate-binding protein